MPFLKIFSNHTNYNCKSHEKHHSVTQCKQIPAGEQNQTQHRLAVRTQC